MSKPRGEVGSRKPGGPKHRFVPHAEPRLKMCAECGKSRLDKGHQP